MVRKLSFTHLDEKNVPAAVRALLAVKLPGATVQRWETEVLLDGTRVFEVHVRSAEGRDCELSAIADGRFRYTECKLPITELPPAVRKAVDDRVPSAEIVEVEHQLGGESEVWSVEARGATGTWEMSITSEGDVLERARVLKAKLKILVLP